MLHHAAALASRSTRWLVFMALSIAAIAMPGVAAAADLNASPSSLSSVYGVGAGRRRDSSGVGQLRRFRRGVEGVGGDVGGAVRATATISPNLGAGVSNLRFDGLTIDGAYTNGARNVAFVNSRFTGLVRVDTPANVSNANVLFDHDTFDGLNATALL